MAYILPFFWLCVFPSGKWQPSHPVVEALPFFPTNGHVLADAAALFAVTVIVVKVFRPCAFLAWALVLTHFLPCSHGFVVPTSSRLLSDTVHALHYVALIDIPVILIYILASPRASFLSNTSFSHVWRLFKVPHRSNLTHFFTDFVVHLQGCFVRNFVPLLCIAFLPASSAMQKTIIHGLGGACKWAMLGKYSFNAFSRGFVDVFLWGVLCSTLPTWDATTGEFTGYFTLLCYVALAAVIEVCSRCLIIFAASLIP
jgi:hypothetical protein